MEDAAYKAAREISVRTKPDDTLAVLNITSSSDNLSIQIITWLENSLLNTGNCKIVSRQRMDAAMKEQNFGLSGYINDKSAQSIGKLVGANIILAGDFKSVNNISYLNIQALETETAVLIYSSSFRIRDNGSKTAETKQKPFRF